MGACGEAGGMNVRVIEVLAREKDRTLFLGVVVPQPKLTATGLETPEGEGERVSFHVSEPGATEIRLALESGTDLVYVEL